MPGKQEMLTSAVKAVGSATVPSEVSKLARKWTDPDALQARILERHARGERTIDIVADIAREGLERGYLIGVEHTKVLAAADKKAAAKKRTEPTAAVGRAARHPRTSPATT